ncbi:GNAT family N-acetyltransferase [Bacteroidota bacterium]
MKLKIRIRKFREGDDWKVSNLCRRCISEINSEDLSEKEVQFLLDEFSPAGVKNYAQTSSMYVAMLHDEIAGTGNIMENQIRGVFINPDYLGFGIGRKIMNYIEGIAKRKGLKSVYLNSSAYAKDFYLKLGYKKNKDFNSPVGVMTKMTKKLES